ncbi:MAG: thymidine phosphorylase, partial [Chloroflexota bacterium]
GYRVDLSIDEFKRQLKKDGIVLTGQSFELAPADGKLYALRDVTGTVQSIPLIASSIMSKKIAGGAQAILLDIKVGLGAFMQTLKEAHKLARLMVDIGELAGLDVVTLLSDMNQPLGESVGNALEVVEAIDTLHGNGPADFREHCLRVSAHMLKLGHRAADLESGRRMAEAVIASGAAFEKLRILVQAQEGDVSYVDDPQKFPKARFVEVVKADRNGYLSRIHARKIGEAAVSLGAGRAHKGDLIDHTVGFCLHGKVGDFVKQDQPLFTIYANDSSKQAGVRESLLGAFGWSEQPVPSLPLFYE